MNAVLSLVVKATSFIAQLQDGWYKGSVELDTLQSKIWVLKARHGQWNEEKERYGISEGKYLLLLVEETDKALENFRGKVEKLEKSCFRRLKKKAFPSQLLYLVDKICEIVNAGPQVLASRLANNDILDKYSAQTPSSLPFGPDINYVPIADSILAVRNALDNSGGPRVVTIYGGPGTGKSSLLKYLAIRYQEEQKRLGAEASFPHGVYYIFCGQHAGKRINQLVLELLQNHGYGTRSVAVHHFTPSSTGSQDGDYLALHTNQIQLRSRLAEQKLLIMVDDLWDAKVLPELLVPAKGVKYLVTSQMRDICSTAQKIPITMPTLPECCQIMANYTHGLSEMSEFPDNIKNVAKDLAQRLHYHPLSVANIGISIDRSRATDIKQWDVIRKHLYVHLDENESCSAVAYDRPYCSSVSASTVLMVESLLAEERRLLFAMALLEGPDLPESVVKYLYSFIQKDNFLMKYNHNERCLKAKSLIELTVRGDKSILNVDSLRMHYIRERKALEVRSVSSHILSSNRDGDEDVAHKAIMKGDAEETLVTILSAVYYHLSFQDLVAGTLENHIRLINDGVIPQNLKTETDALGLVESARGKQLKIRDLVWLLNVDPEADNWKREAHESAKRIIIKFVCQGKLEDNSMAQLLRLPQTTTAACEALRALCQCHAADFYDRNLAFSEAYPKTMETLVCLFECDAMSMNHRTGVIISLLAVLSYESNDYIRRFATKHMRFLAMKSECILRSLVVAFRDRWVARGVSVLVQFGGFWESIIAELVEFVNFNHTERVMSRRDLLLLLDVVLEFCQCRDLALKIAAFPEALKTLFHFFSSYDLPASHDLRWRAELALYHLSTAPENRIKIGATKGIWNGLGDILTKLEHVWWATPKWKDRLNVARPAAAAAAVLGLLTLEKDFRDTIVSMPGVKEGLLFLQLLEMATTYVLHSDDVHQSNVKVNFFSSTRALMSLFSEEPGDPRTAFIPSTGDMLNLAFSCDEGAPSMTSSIIAEKCYLSLYWTQVWGFMQMGSYAEALQILDMYLIPKMEMLVFFSDRLKFGFRTSIFYTHGVHDSHVSLRDCRIFLQAMVGDYKRALLNANQRVRECKTMLYLAERGVLKRFSGDLQGALDGLNAAAAYVELHPRITKHEILWQRGYVKWLMGDTVGARGDAEVAQGHQERFSGLPMLDESEAGISFLLHKIPVTYLGYSL